jgi:hypothetical protein
MLPPAEHSEKPAPFHSITSSAQNDGNALFRLDRLTRSPNAVLRVFDRSGKP